MHLKYLAIAALCALSSGAPAAELKMYYYWPGQKDVVESVIADFEVLHPDIDVTLSVRDHEAFKIALRNWLVTNSPDVVVWGAGERMRTFARLGLLADISDLWEAEGLHASMASTASAMGYKGKQYGVPIGYFNFGLFYRSDVMEDAGVAVPTTFEGLLDACRTLRSANIVPFTIGTKETWTTGVFFDYLNLRANGLDEHLKLLSGETKFSEPKILKVFDLWKQMIDAGCFLEDHASYTWNDAAAFMYKGEAAMTLMGSFLTQGIPADLVDVVDVATFPAIDSTIPVYEDAPIESVLIPARASNIEDAKKLLAFIATPEIQARLAGAVGLIPTHRDAAVKDDKYMKAGQQFLANAKGVAQFFDRDTDPDFALKVMDQFQRFMLNPDQLDDIVSRLDAAQEEMMANTTE